MFLYVHTMPLHCEDCLFLPALAIIRNESTHWISFIPHALGMLNSQNHIFECIVEAFRTSLH